MRNRGTFLSLSIIRGFAVFKSGECFVAAANDNRNARRKRVNANAARSVATMTRIIHDLYGSEATKHPDAECGREVVPEPISSP